MNIRQFEWFLPQSGKNCIEIYCLKIRYYKQKRLSLASLNFNVYDQ